MAETSEVGGELAKADRHIAESEARLARQAELVRELEADGHDTTDAQKLLQTMTESLNAMEAHRQQIVRELSIAERKQR